MACIPTVQRTIAMTACAALFDVASAADWPPQADRLYPHVISRQGRTIERYIHGGRPEWGYPDSQSWAYPDLERPSPTDIGPTAQRINSFYVVSPRHPREGAPMVVWLHSANRTGFVYLAYQFLVTGNPSYDADPGNVAMAVPDDCYGLYLNTTNAEWWGWSALRDHPVEYADRSTPAENRVLDTIEWVASTYHVDRDRIYLCGVSMGGCGALGIGLPRGDIFAAMMVWVPAGTGYGARRFGLPTALAGGATEAERAAWISANSGSSRHDPPVLLNLSSPTDDWSKDQDVLVQAADTGHLPLVLGWGPFGHSPQRNHAARHAGCAAVLDVPWLSIRRNVSYPVFTAASSDARCPWRGAAGPWDGNGQSNAFFRWENVHDREDGLAMRLWLAQGAPAEVTVDVTPRRMQRFRLPPGQACVWRLERSGRQLATGTIRPDAAGLLTIPRLVLTAEPAELSLGVGGP